MGVRSTRSLEADGIAKSLGTLHMRIVERFPGSGLSLCCTELLETAQLTAARAASVGRPNYPLRMATALLIAAALWGVYLIGVTFGPAALAFFLHKNVEFSSAAQALDSGVNLAIVIGFAIWSMISLEAQLKRRIAIKHLHELRSHAHVVDMRQLTKDPISIQNPDDRTQSSPERNMTPFELARYLSYCTEMLSLIGKLAELYAEQTDDKQIIEAASDVEALSSNIGRKIWQKLMILNEADFKAVR
ncbi:MAG: hypothetical protein MRY74_11575 [Neomegalonema sp.]|nr:hypothetical protein [Neomegalonema sp.]